MQIKESHHECKKNRNTLFLVPLSVRMNVAEFCLLYPQEQTQNVRLCADEWM
jgi:hypothetical protein